MRQVRLHRGLPAGSKPVFWGKSPYLLGIRGPGSAASRRDRHLLRGQMLCLGAKGGASSRRPGPAPPDECCVWGQKVASRWLQPVDCCVSGQAARSEGCPPGDIGVGDRILHREARLPRRRWPLGRARAPAETGAKARSGGEIVCLGASTPPFAPVSAPGSPPIGAAVR